MKLIKILIFTMVIVLTIATVGCDLSDFAGESLGDAGSDLTGSDQIGENANDHVCDFRLESKIDSTCEEPGVENYRCSCGKAKKETLSLLPHTEVTDPGKEPTEAEPGKTEGKHCSLCGEILVKQEYVFYGDYSVAEKYDGDYAYNSLLKLDNAEKLTKLYNDIDKIADSFHNSVSDAKEEHKYIIADIDFSELDLTEGEALAAWCAYRIDHPLYYWLSSMVYYSESELSIACDADYAKASDRAALNLKIYNGVKEFVEEAYSASKYNTVLGFHDLIILSIDYAYESDGKTPEDDAWAHNVIGVFDKGAGVCEAYSKTFQLLLNYCDIENVLVSGFANEPHAWNLVKLDDGMWYWCDLTWDDTPDFAWGISYRYFCVNDTQNVGWTDGPFTMQPSTFLSSHIPYEKVDTGVNYNYELPARSSSEFDGAEIMLRDTFDVGNLTYAIAGYNSVQLVAARANGNIEIPSSVAYLGESFKVISVGKIENGKFTVGSIAAYKNGIYTEQYTVNYVSIPESVIFIWDDAFNMDALVEISVSADNKKFTSRDGVLFTKDLSVLIKYPNAKTGKSYTLPGETRIIAAGAFTTLYSNTGDKLLLEKIYLSADNVEAGVKNYGYSYERSDYTESNPWDKIREKLSADALIYDKNGNPID